MPKQYDPKWSEPTEPEKPASNLRSIEGGRAIAAQEVLSQFASETETLSVNCQDMAGFMVVVWDDEGGMHRSFFNAPRSPYSPEMLTSLLSEKIKAAVHTATEVE